MEFNLEPEPDDEVRFWRFADLKRLGIVSGRSDYYRKIQLFNFPPAVRLGGEGLGSFASHRVVEVKAWLKKRMAESPTSGPKPPPPRPGARPRGRPAKIQQSAGEPVE